ncbi:hypothetical protein DFH08DRAFT_828751 [Mycena albidolilacea]|uniref:Uncharacterized protein n=1 Tax=Mycena albidolilacea TaxID=1033008 RepID=A0AAD7ATA7_9AGAR|nr:hypothetical protein DFH08DRAFT_828751 [Mycena albidolilacea]
MDLQLDNGKLKGCAVKTEKESARFEQEDMESLKIEITSASLKVEECQAVGSLKIEPLDQSVEYPEVEDKESPKVEHDEASPTTEENKESYKNEDNKNSEALEIGCSDSQCALKPIQSENVPGFNHRVNYEEKPLKVEVKSELMDVDYADLTQMELGPSAGNVEEIGSDCGVASTPPQDDDAARVAFLHGSERHPTPPSDLGSDDDVRMDAEDHVSPERAARTVDEISTVGRATSVPRQLVIQDEHTEMGIDSVSNTTDKARPEKRRRMHMDYVFCSFRSGGQSADGQ